MRKGQTRDNFPSKARLKDAGVAPAPFESAKRLIGETPTGRLPGQLTLARPELREKILNAANVPIRMRPHTLVFEQQGGGLDTSSLVNSRGSPVLDKDGVGTMPDSAGLVPLDAEWTTEATAVLSILVDAQQLAAICEQDGDTRGAVTTVVIPAPLARLHCKPGAHADLAWAHALLAANVRPDPGGEGRAPTHNTGFLSTAQNGGSGPAYGRKMAEPEYAPPQGLLQAWEGPPLRLPAAEGRTPIQLLHAVGDWCAMSKFEAAHSLVPELMACQHRTFTLMGGGGAKSLGGTPYLGQAITVHDEPGWCIYPHRDTRDVDFTQIQWMDVGNCAGLSGGAFFNATAGVKVPIRDGSIVLIKAATQVHGTLPADPRPAGVTGIRLGCAMHCNASTLSGLRSVEDVVLRFALGSTLPLRAPNGLRSLLLSGQLAA